MSFEGKNDLKASEIFNERLMYGAYAYSKDGLPNFSPCLTRNLWDSESLFYGRLNFDKSAVQANLELMEYISGEARAGGAESVMVFNFVAEAFKSFRNEFLKAQNEVGIIFDEVSEASSGEECGPCKPASESTTTIVAKTTKINTESPFLAMPTPVKGFSSMETKYRRHKNLLFQHFLNTYASKLSIKNQIKDFDSFIPLYLEFVKQNSLTFPYFRSAYVLSRYNSPMNTGLCVEISELKYSSDKEKYDLFISDPNFDFYKIMAAKHGFVIDKNIPWRLIADLASEPMLEYANASLYGQGSIANVEDIVEKCFYEVYEFEIDDLKSMAVATYNSIVRSTPSIYVTCYGAKCATTTEIVRAPEEPDAIYAKYDNSFWLEEYVLIKNAESNLKYTPPAIDKIIKNAQDLENSFDIGKALGYINRKFRGVSSFEGSLYYKSVKLEVEENNEEGSTHFVDDIRSAIKKSKKVMY